MKVIAYIVIIILNEETAFVFKYSIDIIYRATQSANFIISVGDSGYWEGARFIMYS